MQGRRLRVTQQGRNNVWGGLWEEGPLGGEGAPEKRTLPAQAGTAFTRLGRRGARPSADPPAGRGA